MRFFPGIPFIGRESMFHDLIQQMTGRSQLPLYELDEQHVLNKGNIRPFENPRGFTGDPKCLMPGDKPDYLNFRAWKLAHAIKKADCAKNAYTRLLPVWSFGFLLESARVFRWNKDNLRLGEGMANCFADFSRTSLSGRVAQGMAILFMERRDYSYVGRYPPVQPTNQLSGNRKTPDFIFEKASGTQALIESKGGFVTPGTSSPKIKGDLKKALEQLSVGGWSHAKKFAIGTYLHEENDGNHEPSLTAFVEQNSDGPHSSQKPQDSLRRESYAAWLYGMGLTDIAADFREGRVRNDQVSILFPKIRLGREDYVVGGFYFRPSFRTNEDLHFDWWEFMEFFEPYPWFRGGMTVGIMGTKLSVMRQISESLRTGAEEPMMRLEIPGELVEPEWPTQLEDGIKVDGSLFSDGTLLGELTFQRGRFPRLEVEEIPL